ncbi:uncharacterized protein L969DRAFT_553074 [Mixia osmundae IAM 14324]|uniref:uncharacterized protein n=1 Tax=Mixia osmundae (strain CBS 9802 / IAM 14324 / JCM 22182 / KY 12970) TaxID=764103 RepID=UPI0004A553DA|nr:uncharacterized protein L969DRAFT_553074 [Mixia osmundae IAM 14324]KEI37862.1 hypothetical protein L969DRAFT_553074 [Mixia osmundae IAM 14324]
MRTASCKSIAPCVLIGRCHCAFLPHRSDCKRTVPSRSCPCRSGLTRNASNSSHSKRSHSYKVTNYVNANSFAQDGSSRDEDGLSVDGFYSLHIVGGGENQRSWSARIRACRRLKTLITFALGMYETKFYLGPVFRA